MVSAPRTRFTRPRLRLRWRLAERASAAALGRPAVPAGKWVYQQTVIYQPGLPKGVPARLTQGAYSTADGSLRYLGGVWGWGPGHSLYSKLDSLPRDPAALDEYLARPMYPEGKATPAGQATADFTTIEELLASAVLPPALNARLFQALGAIPGISVKSHVRDVTGRAGVAFVLPQTPQSANLEIILDASDYHYLAQASWGSADSQPDSAISFTEIALLKTTLMSGPDSTQADPAPPQPGRAGRRSGGDDAAERAQAWAGRSPPRSRPADLPQARHAGSLGPGR